VLAQDDGEAFFKFGGYGSPPSRGRHRMCNVHCALSPPIQFSNSRFPVPSPLWGGWRVVSAANNGPGGGFDNALRPHPGLRFARPTLPTEGEGDVRHRAQHSDSNFKQPRDGVPALRAGWDLNNVPSDARARLASFVPLKSEGNGAPQGATSLSSLSGSPLAKAAGRRAHRLAALHQRCA
jgi:hypothetical protein